MFSNKVPNIQYFFLTFIITLLTASSRCETLVHVSKSTNCTITFEIGMQNDSNTGTQFLNCTRHLCLRNLMDGKCTRVQKFQFQQEKCYRECCGSNQFDFMKCQTYNEQRQAKKESTDQKLVIILVASLCGVLTAVIIFAIFYLKCCANEQKTGKPKENLENQFQWKDVAFTDQKCCIKCKESGAFVLLSCGTYYHLRCLNDNDRWECDHCMKTIKKAKIFCPKCLRKYTVIKAQNFDELDKKTVQMYSFHPSKCMEEMLTQMDTERKFSESTKQ